MQNPKKMHQRKRKKMKTRFKKHLKDVVLQIRLNPKKNNTKNKNYRKTNPKKMKTVKGK